MKSFNENENEELNKMDHYKDKKCIYCNAKYPDTILNIEGHIHHKEPYRCLDTKLCNKRKKKKNHSEV